MNSVWFNNLNNDFQFDISSLKILVKYIQSELISEIKFNDKLSDEIINDVNPRIVFISVSDGVNKAKIFNVSAIGILNAVKQAIANINDYNIPNIKWIKVDFVDKCCKNIAIDSEQIKKMVNNHFGFAHNAIPNIAVLNEDIWYNSLFDSNELIIDEEKCKLYFHEEYNTFKSEINSCSNCWTLFTTKGFFIDNNELVELYSGHKLFNQLNKENIKESVINAGKYLVRSIADDGKFNYWYEPREDVNLPSYNILRHCGTVYALLELYDVSKKKEFMDTAVKAINYVINNFIKPVTINGIQTNSIVENFRIKLGGNALAILALVKYTKLTGDLKYKKIIDSIANWVKYSQDSNGYFRIHKQNYLDNTISNFRSDYYDGEVIFALLRLYELDNNKDWLDLAQRAVEYIIANFAEQTIENHHHWLMYALNELYSIIPDKKYVEHSLKIANEIMKSQVTESKDYDVLGCFGYLCSSTSTATRVEGLLAAYNLCKKTNYSNHLEKLFNSIELGIKFQLKSQYRPEIAMYFQDPQRILWSFPHGFSEPSVRIDYIQHNISALINYCKILN